MSVRSLFALIVIGVGTCGLFAQNPPVEKEEVIKVDTQLVDVPVIITDRQGRPILNLKRQNFAVFEDGKLQEILDFSATSAPFEVALLLDTSGSTRADLQLIRQAAESFVSSLRPGDRVAVIAYDSAVAGTTRSAVTDILTGLTNSRSALSDALSRVSTSNGTPYYDSIVEVVDNVFRNEPSEEYRGRRALVALTDGVDSTSVSDFRLVREKLDAAGVISFFIQIDTRPFFEENLLGDCSSAIRFSAAQIQRYYGSFSPGSRVERTFDFCKLGDFERLAVSKRLYELADIELNQLSRSSGGKVFPVRDLSEARTAFRYVANEIGTKYSLGYYSSNEKRDGTFRKIRVELRGVPAGASVRAREGYTAPVN
jgi:Ca-activated chloride channel family protein